MRYKKSTTIAILFVLMVSLVSPMLGKSEDITPKYRYNVQYSDLLGYHITEYENMSYVYEYEALLILRKIEYELYTDIEYNSRTRMTDDDIDNCDFEAQIPSDSHWGSNWNTSYDQDICIDSDLKAICFNYSLPVDFNLSSYWNNTLTLTLRGNIFAEQYPTYGTFEEYIQEVLINRANNYDTSIEFINGMIESNTNNTMIENPYWNMFIYQGISNVSILNQDNTERTTFYLDIYMEECYNIENKMTYYYVTFHVKYDTESGSIIDNEWVHGEWLESNEKRNERTKYLVYERYPTVYPYKEQLTSPIYTNMEYNIQPGNELHYNSTDSYTNYYSLVNISDANLHQITKANDLYSISIPYEADYVEHIVHPNNQWYLITLVNKNEVSEKYEFISYQDFQEGGTTVKFIDCSSFDEITDTELENIQNNLANYNVTMVFAESDHGNDLKFKRMYFDEITYNENGSTTISTKKKMYNSDAEKQRFNIIDWSLEDTELYLLENNLLSIINLMQVLPNDMLIRDWQTESMVRIFLLGVNSGSGIFKYIEHDPIEIMTGEMYTFLLEASNEQTSISDAIKTPYKNVISDRCVEFAYNIFIDATGIVFENNLMNGEINLGVAMTLNYDSNNILNDSIITYNSCIKIIDPITNEIYAEQSSDGSMTENRVFPPTFDVFSETLGLNLITEIDISDYVDIPTITIDWGDGNTDQYTSIITENKYMAAHQYSDAGNYTFIVRFHDEEMNVFAVYTSENVNINKMRLTININYNVGSEFVYQHNDNGSIGYMKMTIFSIESANISGKNCMNITCNSQDWNETESQWNSPDGGFSYLIDDELTTLNDVNALLFKPIRVTNEQWEFYLKLLTILSDQWVLNYDNYIMSYNEASDIFKLQTSLFESPDWKDTEYQMGWNKDGLITSLKYAEENYLFNINIVPLKLSLNSTSQSVSSDMYKFVHTKGFKGNVSFNVEAMNWSYTIKRNGTTVQNGNESIPMLDFSQLAVGNYSYEVIVTDAFGRTATEIFEVVILPQFTDDESSDDESDKPKWWVAIIVGSAAGGGIGIFYILKARKGVNFSFRKTKFDLDEFCKLNPTDPRCLK